MNLKNNLKEKPNGEYLYHNLEKIEKNAEPLLAKISDIFSEYTIHDIRHSKNVISILDWLIPSNLKKKLNEYEIYFLISGAYLHDIGMVDFPELLKEDFDDFAKKEKRKSPKSTEEGIKRKYIRKYHHLRSENFINKHWKELSIEDKPQARIIGRICRGHRDNLNNRSLYNNKEMYTSKNIPINAPVLSAFLKIADELDLTFERAPLIIYETIRPIDPISTDEWEKHLSISGVGLDPSDPLKIIITAICENPKVHRALKRLETKIQSILDEFPNYLFQYGEYIKEFPRRISINIESNDYMAYDFKFTLQEKEITNLLLGERLYDRKEACLRELLQNSLDACRIRMHLHKKQGLDFKPFVSFELTTDKDKIIVRDNGTGMDESIVDRYLTKVGKCFYTSPEFLEEEPNFTPVSQFGIGILSCFMIAYKIIIETKTYASDPLLIEIDSVEDYFFVKKGKTTETGTVVTLFPKDEVNVDLKKEVRQYARHIEFPIKVIQNGKEYLIEDQGFRPDLDSYIRRIGYSGHLVKDRYEFYPVKIKEENFEGIIGFLFEKGFKPVTDPYLLGRVVTISNEGVFVNYVDEIVPEWFVGSIFVDMNIKNNILDLNIARNNVIRNEKFREFTNLFEEILRKNLLHLHESLKTTK